MEWSIVTPLVGVVLGASIPLLGVLLSNRASRAEAEAKRQTELRGERRTAIMTFLRETQDCENFISRLRRDATSLPTGEELVREHSDRNSEMWVKARMVQLMASTPLWEATQAYADRLDDAMYTDQVTTTIWDFVRDHRRAFMEAARSELGFDDVV